MGTPFLISSPAHMQAIGANISDWDQFFKLTADIDMSGFDGAGGNPAYNVIGTDPNRFVGQFDGDGFAISNLTINETGVINLGLFGFVGTGGVITNLELVNPTVTSDTGGVGSLIGILKGGDVFFCQMTGCQVSGTISVGGLIGESSDASINSCGVTGIVNGIDQVGGLIGQNIFLTTNSIISSCFANTTLSGSGFSVGGLIGKSQFSTLTNSYSLGSVTGNEEVGGLVGRMDFLPSTVSLCYAACSVSGNSQVGGLVGGLGTTPTIVNSYWDSEINGQNQMCGVVNGGCDDSFGRTTAEMRQESTYSNWDFMGEATNGVADIWRICEGLNTPKLAWQIPSADWVCPDGVGAEDVAVLAEQWLLEILSGDVGPGSRDGKVNFLDWGALSGGDPVDITDFAGQWLKEGATIDDIAPNGGNGYFDLVDFSELSSQWMTGL